MPSTIDKIKREIKKVDNPENKLNYQRFYKEKLDDPWRIKTAVMRILANTCFKDIKHLSKREILDLCDDLLESKMDYGFFIAIHWASKLQKDYTKSDFPRFERWLKNHVDEWGSCDYLCCWPLGNLVKQYPDLAPRVIKWTKSKNLWVRRASAISLIVPVRNGLLLDEIFKTSDILLMDKEDLVQKGYGWTLKEAANNFPNEVFKYVMKNKNKMPRTALRYAIEKYPQKKRKLAMAK